MSIDPEDFGNFPTFLFMTRYGLVKAGFHVSVPYRDTCIYGDCSMTKRGILTAAGAGLIFMGTQAAAQIVYSGNGANAVVAATNFAAVLGSSTVQDFEAFAVGDLAPSWSYGVSGTATLSNGFGVTSTYPYGGGAVSGSKGYGAYPSGGFGGVPLFAFTSPLRAFGAYFVDFES
ncbi:MAG: hypothetical protein H7267_08900, partial [Sandarakinorhabdus sp.]|nr:hypothetical protein [Sandarakinorhabdus sp.]